MITKLLEYCFAERESCVFAMKRKEKVSSPYLVLPLYLSLAQLNILFNDIGLILFNDGPISLKKLPN